MIEYFIFGLTAASVLLLVLSLIFLFKQRVLEDHRLTQGIDTLLFGLIFFGLYLIIKHVESANNIFDLGISFIGTFVNIANLAFLPLMAICFFVAVLMFKEI